MKIFVVTAVAAVLTAQFTVEGFLLKKKSKKSDKDSKGEHGHRHHHHHHHIPHGHAKHVSHASHHMTDFHHGGEVEIHEMDIGHANDFMHMIQHHDMHAMRPAVAMPMMMPTPLMTRMPLMAAPMSPLIAAPANPMMAQMMMMMNMINMMRAGRQSERLRVPSAMSMMNQQQPSMMTMMNQQQPSMMTMMNQQQPSMMTMMNQQHSSMIPPTMMTAMASESSPTRVSTTESFKKHGVGTEAKTEHRLDFAEAGNPEDSVGSQKKINETPL